MSCGCNDGFGANLSEACLSDPCAVSETNTVACESLPSQLQNFTDKFFGDVVKSEVDGKIVWVLPCDLETGLPANPRAEGEGLACYFLRLFGEGIVGLTGAKGDTGAPGADGKNAYSVTIQGFNQPTPENPNVSVRFVANPAIRVGATVYIDLSGYYTVNAIGADWLVMLTLVKAWSGAASYIGAGQVVVVSGPQGLVGQTGAVGPQGPAGPQGSAGIDYTQWSGFTVGVGSTYDLLVTYSRVVFGTVEPEVTLPTAGIYLVQGIVGIEMAADALGSCEQIKVKLFNASTSEDVPYSEQIVKCFYPSNQGQIVVHVMLEVTDPGQTLQLYGAVTTEAKASVIAERTILSYFRLK